MNTFPIVGARIHPPLLRTDVLSRERLNGWLEQAVTGRLALVIAEAGFGKTTLLADWARHSARLTAWYRLDPDDRDWLTFARHLVASGRELDPDFAPQTYGLLMDLGPGGPSREDITASLAAEVSEFGSAHAPGLTLIFDDYHAVDGSDEVVPTVRALLDRTGPGFSIIIASRSVPKLPISRLRARGAVSRLNGDALCFEPAEADRLFRDAYHLPLDREVVDELVDRTDGWAALLSLVRTNLEGRSADIGTDLVRGLSDQLDDIYEYLADEILAHLPDTLGDFLAWTSLLEDVDPFAASLAAGVSEEEAIALLAAAERLALMQRVDPHGSYRFTPLVRDFLQARITTNIGAAAILSTHLAIAERAEGRDWRRAATHYRRAGQHAKARRVVGEALEDILATGQWRAADDLLAGEIDDEIVRNVLRSRVLLQVGAISDAITLSGMAVEAARAGANANLPLAAQNAATIAVAARRYSDAVRYASLVGAINGSSEPYSALIGAAGDASLPALARQFEAMLATQTERGQLHYAAITSLNLAQILVWLDRTGEASRLAGDALRHLLKSSNGYEAVSARLVLAQAKAFEGRWAEAAALIGDALATDHPEAEKEVILEGGELASWFGPYELAPQLLQRSDRQGIDAAWMPAWKSLDLWLEDQPEAMAESVAGLTGDPRLFGVAGATFRWHITLARTYLRIGRFNEYSVSLDSAERVADRQGSPIQRRLASVLRAIGEGPESVSRLLAAWPEMSDPLLGVFAFLIARNLGAYSDSAAQTVSRAALANGHRWRVPLRECLDSADPTSALRAADVLEQIGERTDVIRLKRFARREKKSGRPWGEALAQRLAPRMMIEDLGPSSISIGERHIEGRQIRRKVLALLLFLASQPDGSATPDQVLEAMWPDLRTAQGINSVHQTVYFLRRVIDPEYRTGISPEYVHFNSDVIWLDRVLVDCRSWLCRRLLSHRPESARVIDQLLGNYHGRFAPEFAYEEWATAYRDGLHAAFLSAVEQAVSGKPGSADLRWRLWVCQQALMVDPEADSIEAIAIRLYRSLGATAAAAEQYAHYASVLRDELGIEPPAIDEV